MTAEHGVRPMRRVGVLEGLLWGTGILILALCAAALVHRAVSSRADLERFDEARAGKPGGSAPAPQSSAALAEPPVTDFSLWAPGRVKGYRESLLQGSPLPLAVLEMPRLGLRAAVLEGTDEVTLNRGLGHIEGTPLPGGGGNVGISGHRDGFFRCLKDVREGDRVRLVLSSSVEDYVVTRTRIVSPEEVSVLAPTPGRTLTLVTCYPFYYVGSAPQRFIVTAAPPSSTGHDRLR